MKVRSVFTLSEIKTRRSNERQSSIDVGCFVSLSLIRYSFVTQTTPGSVFLDAIMSQAQQQIKRLCV